MAALVQGDVTVDCCHRVLYVYFQPGAGFVRVAQL